jgi:hypothetical protein
MILQLQEFPTEKVSLFGKVGKGSEYQSVLYVAGSQWQRSTVVIVRVHCTAVLPKVLVDLVALAVRNSSWFCM